MIKPVHPFDFPERIDSFLRYLSQLSLVTQEPNTLFSLIENTLELIPFSGISIEKGTTLFRARTNSPFVTRKFFETISELTLRADADIKTYGRANLPGQATFTAH